MRDKIFISYSHQDKKHKERLETHLKSYNCDDSIAYWSDTDISPGSSWDKAITDSINQTAIAILLLSADFMASDYIREKELPLLLKANKEDGILIICVYLNYCNPNDKLTQFQYVNSPNKPVATIPKQNREQVWARLAACAFNSLSEYKKASAKYNNSLKIHKAIISGLALTFFPYLGIIGSLATIAGTSTITALFCDLFKDDDKENV